MTAVVVVVARVSTNQPDEMSLIEDDRVIEKLSSATADPALRHGILPGATIGYPTRLSSQRP
jgi:hypothetical protein